jgi:hypothetical protein
MQQFFLGIFVVLTPSVLFLAWLVWQTSAQPQRRTLIGGADIFDRD